MVSLVIHAVLIVVAGSFVAVRVIVKEDPTFEAKKVKRPKMPPKKIQVPVDVKKRKPKPRLRKRIVSTKTFTDIKMPEITGVKGGLGNMGGDGLGSLGFDLNFNFFGIRGGGRHVVFVIDYSASMKGEKEKIMRREAARVISELPKTTEFGVIFFAGPAWPATS
ncbi:MAG: VWA domain-containing protein, partial [Verrucomicrobia bacterium]|nr:VWA domain-containing protein [Verrucomicrobiota bacterium]